MSTVRKYAGLPDLDPAPDTYETPELTDDNSTYLASTTFRSESPEYDQEDVDKHGIDRHRINPDEARTHFLSPAERDPNSSSRISSKRKSYRSSSRKRRKDDNELNGLINGIDFPSDEEEESLDRKLVRLRREIAEVKEEVSQSEKQGTGSTVKSEEGETLDNLSEMLQSIALPSAISDGCAATRLGKQLAKTSALKESSVHRTQRKPSEQDEEGSRYTISYAPRYHEDHTLAKIADFDSRLALLENVLGIDAIPLPTQERTAFKAVLPSLDKLDQQLDTLSTASETSLDSVSRKVRQLTQDAEKLENARKAAKAAQEALRQEQLNSPGNNPRPEAPSEAPNLSEFEDPETVSKINALYGTLSTIESLAPILPAVLERLLSLRTIHADAATASQALAEVESRQEEMREEIQSWREGLEKVEKAMEEGEKTMKVNTETVERWVKDLEDRMRNLGQ